MSIAAFWASCAFGQQKEPDWAATKLAKSSRHGELVQLKHGDRTLQAWVVYPEVAKKATAVVVIHEIFGLSDWVRLAADEFAEAGYIAIAPDLVGPLKPGEKMMQAVLRLPAKQVLADLDAAADYIKSQPAANGKGPSPDFAGAARSRSTLRRTVRTLVPRWCFTELRRSRKQ